MPTGRNSITGIGEQSAKGTIATEYTKLRVTSNSVERSITTGQSEALTGNRFTDDQFVTGHAVGGSIDAELAKSTIPIILKHAIGPEEGAPTDLGSGTGPYEHVFKPSATIDDWLSILKEFTDAAYYEEFQDCKINQMSFSLTSQSVITYTLDLLGISGSTTQGSFSGTINENAGEKLFAWDASVNMLASDVTADVDEYSFTHNNNLDDGDYGLSQERRSLDVQDGEHTFNLTMQFDAAQYTDMQAGMVEGNIISDLQVDIGLASDESTPFMSVVYPKVKLSQVSAPVSGGGKVTVDVQGRALWDSATGTNVEIKIADDSDTAY